MVTLPKFTSVMSGSYKKDRRTSGGSSSSTGSSSYSYGSSTYGWANARTGKSHKNQNKAKGKRKDRFGQLGNGRVAKKFDTEFPTTMERLRRLLYEVVGTIQNGGGLEAT